MSRSLQRLNLMRCMKHENSTVFWMK
jgi:hypothetical protein